MKKKKEYSFERLTELERQVREYSDDDLVEEANTLEHEMGRRGNADLLSEDFFKQILAEAKKAEQSGKKDSI